MSWKTVISRKIGQVADLPPHLKHRRVFHPQGIIGFEFKIGNP
mgnify:CR=1 FL=1